MQVLALDTSSAAVTAALCEVGDSVNVLAHHQVVDARGHGENLAPVVARCVENPRLLQAIVIGVGPGPYTGLRVGLVTAAVLSETLGIPAYGVCSLDGIAAGEQVDGHLVVLADARRKEVYWARYDEHGDRVDGPHVSRPDGVPLDGVGDLAGAGAHLYADRFPGRNIRPTQYPSPAALVGRAIDRIRASAPSDPLHPALPAPSGRAGAGRVQGGLAVSVASTIVAMTAAHIPALMEHEHELFGAESWSASSYRSELADTRNRRYLVAEDADGTLLGWAGILLLGDAAEILTVGVATSAQRRGIGRQLLTALLDEAGRHDVREVFLEVRIGQRGRYEAL